MSSSRDHQITCPLKMALQVVLLTSQTIKIPIWDGSSWRGLHGLETLVDKCLVELIYDEYEHMVKIWVHNHLRDMGREIATTWSPCHYGSPKQIVNIHNHSEESTPPRGITSDASSFEIFLKTFVETSKRGFKRLQSSLSSDILC
ncbi:hypothetical protein SUGI_0687120 [Cryptomeria japonica]|nr:hypothetical protein SUGI_0687120 [Cryptomeria japonica]